MAQNPQQAIYQQLETAAALLRLIWDGIPAEYKSKYRMDIWSQFQSAVKAAAQRTSTISRFTSDLCFHFENAVIIQREGGTQVYERMLQWGQEEQEDLLALLATDTPSAIAVLRNRLDEEKAFRAEQQPEKGWF